MAQVQLPEQNQPATQPVWSIPDSEKLFIVMCIFYPTADNFDNRTVGILRGPIHAAPTYQRAQCLAWSRFHSSIPRQMPEPLQISTRWDDVAESGLLALFGGLRVPGQDDMFGVTVVVEPMWQQTVRVLEALMGNAVSSYRREARLRNVGKWGESVRSGSLGWTVGWTTIAVHQSNTSGDSFSASLGDTENVMSRAEAMQGGRAPGRNGAQDQDLLDRDDTPFPFSQCSARDPKHGAVPDKSQIERVDTDDSAAQDNFSDQDNSAGRGIVQIQEENCQLAEPIKDDAMAGPCLYPDNLAENIPTINSDGQNNSMPRAPNLPRQRIPDGAVKLIGRSRCVVPRLPADAFKIVAPTDEGNICKGISLASLYNSHDSLGEDQGQVLKSVDDDGRINDQLEHSLVTNTPPKSWVAGCFSKLTTPICEETSNTFSTSKTLLSMKSGNLQTDGEMRDVIEGEMQHVDSRGAVMRVSSVSLMDGDQTEETGPSGKSKLDPMEHNGERDGEVDATLDGVGKYDTIPVNDETDKAEDVTPENDDGVEMILRARSPALNKCAKKKARKSKRKSRTSELLLEVSVPGLGTYSN
ncbi:hypothetical protein K432DRAFT_135977 [Lepidopterella palustris CBS 459.81]|uniref:Uncharacterized protein n=1 Tax=Lepidopterella palustris CBS 459.81 TaxID=1314670 RepID=A0A8E2JCA9_9PEZI|nr:hypothetical protein K432DRAFT_135977 [Lepidopterella palustris CBS 459.81]